MATALPCLLLGLIAGVFVDRYDRKRIMIAADLLRAALMVVLPFLLPFGIAWLYIIAHLTQWRGLGGEAPQNLPFPVWRMLRLRHTGKEV
jgi:MFS family permease